MRLRRSRDSHENPAWPGLVDVFAFLMVLFILLWVQQTSGSDGEEGKRLREKLAELRQQVEDLQSKVDSLAALLPEPGMSAADQVKQESLEDLLALLAKLQDALGENKDDLGAVDSSLVSFPIHRFGGSEIFFASGACDLSAQDVENLVPVAHGLADCIRDVSSAVVIIEGTADPRPLGRLEHPRNNVELSALRAAAVARVLVAADRDLSGRIHIKGIGEVGDPIPNVVDPEIEYRHYRKVTLYVSIDPSKVDV